MAAAAGCGAAELRMRFSDYIVFVDESGDHGMANIDPAFPLFVLSCCLISKRDYMAAVVPAIQRIKFATFGHDAVVLHEREIRRDLGAFSVLRDREKKQAFIDALTDALASAPMTIFSAVLDKRRLQDRQRGENPYEISMRFCLERMYYKLSKQGQVAQRGAALTTHVLCEARGHNEDQDLELAFRRICGGDNFSGVEMPFDPVICDKKSNAIGLQLADLVARPIGMRQLRPDQPNRAWDVIEQKLDKDATGRYLGYGLKCFP
ncbi:DUF3800 domain-containing protein [Xanthomonas oryzae]|uniref:DUF3800 domain-containing protein n=1 Tax=Xanthomonas oryzae TaxID=347 RepID=UPI000969DC08|nr:DUF3800 domain-containing protein [Xanthomonas oryzae]OLI75650.1 3-deoxy-D-manno-octulosonic acid transferase [Xanthomonas oryzae pv. oryzae]OLK32281.1 3-deoxy-D-manno-octulosonic acid transferase [Xanthomonas oryzae pv. oryzae]UXW03828.1 DUF3800 domain-containing protein [Xanthomonas oryzae pv. oryzae]UXW27948.1 DUF3800 domain-containing protein [Xanthomonas oryzae pv. oryzae]